MSVEVAAKHLVKDLILKGGKRYVSIAIEDDDGVFVAFVISENASERLLKMTEDTRLDTTGQKEIRAALNYIDTLKSLKIDSNSDRDV